jgi:predicted SAM-dependent methyltransferase
VPIELKLHPGQRYIELGGGAHPLIRPNVDVRPCYDAQGNPTVDFTADFNEPLLITSEEWDGVFSHFVLEHISWRKVPQFLKEVFRILKPGGKAVIVTANTPAQIKWIEGNPQGWDGRNPFESFSCVLFGDQDYEDNTHRNFMSPEIVRVLLTEAGFSSVEVHPYGARSTDMVVQAVKPGPTDVEMVAGKLKGLVKTPPALTQTQSTAHREGILVAPRTDPATLFDRHYFDCGRKVGGYRDGYRDYPKHELVFRHVLARKPESVLELGCARGYILKRLEDAGVACTGLEVSKHCYLTRAMDDMQLHDLCKTPWPLVQGPPDHPKGWKFDLCFSIATLEHVPEESVPAVIREMVRTCKRGLHGIDFGRNDDGFDKTRVTLKPREWWLGQFATHAPGWPVEVFDKEELERGDFPPEVLQGDGKVKLNIGCFTTMHHGWLNIDIHDLFGFAGQHGYLFQRADVRNGLNFDTGSVDLVVANHFLEHLTYREGLQFLREVRRVIKPDGAVRIIVPDAKLLTSYYYEGYDGPGLEEFDEINDGCAAAPTPAGKLWALLHEGHSACYDEETLCEILTRAGFDATVSRFREDDLSAPFMQIRRETLDQLPCLSLFTNAIPRLG